MSDEDEQESHNEVPPGDGALTVGFSPSDDAEEEFNPFDDEAHACFLFKMWDDCLQLYKLEPGGDYLLTITCSTKNVPGSVGQRAPTVARAMFRATVHYLHKKHIKWRPSL